MSKEKKYTRKELEKKLTPKQYIFCHEYIKNYNGTQAAIKAGYKEKAANPIASQNLAKLYIKQYIDIIKEDIAGEVGISKISLLNELKIMAVANIPLIKYKYETGGIEALSEDEQRAICELSQSDKELKIKVDKRGAIQDILKAMGWNEPDKVDITTQGEKIQKNIISFGGKDFEI